MIKEQNIQDSYGDRRIQIFKVLTHAARIAILEILKDGEHCVCHMEAHLGFRQAYISQQLTVLREAGLIEDRRDGWNNFYRVVDPRIYDILDAVKLMTGSNNNEKHKIDVICSCPHCSGEIKYLGVK